MNTITCVNPSHDHTTYQDREGNSLDNPIPMLCNHDGLPAYYDSAIEDYQHVDGADCFLIHPSAGTSPCQTGAIVADHYREERTED